MERKQMTYYKLLTQDLKSRDNTAWKIGEPITITKKGYEMCSDQVLHCYNHPLLAVIFNRIHANILNPKLFKISVDQIVNTDGLKFASKSQTLIEEIPLPQIGTEQKVEFAIRVAKLVYKYSQWNLWADNWLNGSDRSARSAYNAAYSAADAAAYSDADAAAYSAADAAARAYAAYAAYAADAAATANATDATYATASAVAYSAANVAAWTAGLFIHKNQFNQKMIDIIEEIVKVKV